MAKHLEKSLPKVAGEDPFGPPKEPVLVECIHCGRQFMSDRMKWRPFNRKPHDGLWGCAFDDCDGAGFGFDIHKVRTQEEWDALLEEEEQRMQ